MSFNAKEAEDQAWRSDVKAATDDIELVRELRSLLKEAGEVLADFEFGEDGSPEVWPDERRVGAILAKLRAAGVLKEER